MNTSAGGPLAGFLFQVDLGLLRLFELGVGETFTLERSDDLAVLSAGGRISVEVQVKHSLIRSRSKLTLHSPALWKTIGLWSGKMRGIEYAPPRFHLVSNSTLSKDLDVLGVPSLGRNDAALSELENKLSQVATRGRSKSLRKTYRKWLGIDAHSRESLLRRVLIQAGVSCLSDLQDDVRKAIRTTGVHTSQIEDFRCDLDSWYRDLIRKRIKPDGMKIEAKEFHDQLAYLHRTASVITLHFNHNIEGIPEMIDEVEKSKLYQRQLMLIGANTQLRLDAYEFYLKSRIERQRLMEESLVAREELEDHEDDLVDNWRVTRSEDLDSEQHSAETQGKKLFFRCIRGTSRIINNPVPPFLHVGTLHLLADGPGKPRVGWHPEFEKLLPSLEETADD